MKKILFLLILGSCTFGRDNKTTTAGDSPVVPEKSIVFAVLNIHKDSASSKNEVSLINITQTTGNVKPKRSSSYENYLTIFIYNNKKLVDTMTIEHPLFKHVEYLDEKNSFTGKDIQLEKADFFIRMQIEKESSEIRITETLKNRSVQELNTIKLY